ncbi:MAG: bifunctional riboflavin kinase/FAD synthetase [Actinomycetota bacterium]
MEVWQGRSALPGDGVPSVVTIGFFDGVHRGHQAVFRRAGEHAARLGTRSIAVTFDRHPRQVFAPDTAPRLLTPLRHKAELIAALGVDALAVLEFNVPFSRWSPEDFVARVLAGGLSAVQVVVGANFTFGHKAVGTFQTLTELGEAGGFGVEAVGLLEIEGRTVSSSAIRAALLEGELDWPREALGRRYSVEGHVVSGAGRGSGLGWPTANLRPPEGILMPRDGVYAGQGRRRGGGEWVAAINIGVNPTFGADPHHLEAFLLDYDGPGLKGELLTIEFWERLRDEERFESAEALSEQIGRDVERTREIVKP